MSPSKMPKVSAAERERRAYEERMLRERRADEAAERGGRITQSKAYKSALASVAR